MTQSSSQKVRMTTISQQILQAFNGGSGCKIQDLMVESLKIKNSDLKWPKGYHNITISGTPYALDETFITLNVMADEADEASFQNEAKIVRLNYHYCHDTVILDPYHLSVSIPASDAAKFIKEWDEGTAKISDLCDLPEEIKPVIASWSYNDQYGWLQGLLHDDCCVLHETEISP